MGVLSITPVSGALGAEVLGLDLETIDDEGFAALEQALIDHLVVFIPDQQLSPDGHRDLAKRFGEIEIHPFLQKLSPDHQEIVVLDGDAGARADVWHTDVTFSDSPPLCSILHMVTCPSRGGDTMFSNQYLVYDALSEPMREMLGGLTAVHTAAVFGHPEHQAEHPAVRVHPVTGRSSLYVNRQFTSHFPQLRRGESDVLLNHLFSFSEQPQFQCRYRWAPGGVGIWDNRCTQHYAVNDYDESRLIQRITVLGDHPEGGTPRWSHWQPTTMSASAAGEMGVSGS
ncbi:MAG: taurine dioxygenase [Acidimicrobiia bacterium]|nr:taurine dioxygenase [Acidimicrobiia bacterium]